VPVNIATQRATRHGTRMHDTYNVRPFRMSNEYGQFQMDPIYIGVYSHSVSTLHKSVYLRGRGGSTYVLQISDDLVLVGISIDSKPLLEKR